MARLSRRFSRYFSLKSRRECSSTSASKLHKSKISKPIVIGEDDTHTLLTSSNAHTHSNSSSVYTISDGELHSLEQEKLGRKIEDGIDSIIASYSHIPPTMTADPFSDTQIYSVPASAPIQSSSPTPSSMYSSPPSTPPTRMKAKLERFRDTPPPAPGWDKVCFGRETRLFGPDNFSGAGSGDNLREEGSAGRRKDWRGEFGRRGYAVL